MLRDPTSPAKGYAALDPAASYLVATTDYQATFADGYKEIFAAGARSRITDIDVHAALLEALRRRPARARLDGRTR